MRRSALLTCAVLAACALMLVPAPASALPAADGTASENVTLYHTPESGFDSAAAVEASIERGPAHSAESMLANETLIVVIESDRLAADLDDRSGTTTERFFAALYGPAELGAKEARMTPESPVTELSVPKENATVYRSGRTTYLIVDPTGLRKLDDGEGRWPVSVGDVLRFEFGYGVDDDPGEWSSVELHDRRAEFDDVGETLPAAETDIVANVHVAPTRSAEVRLHLGTGETRTVTLADEPFTHATFDLSDVSNGTSYRAELVHDGEVLETWTGRVTELRATVEDVRYVEGGAEPILNATVTLSHRGSIDVEDRYGDVVASAHVQSTDPTDVSLRLDDVDEFDETVTVHAERADVHGRYYPDHDPFATVDVDDGAVEIRNAAIDETTGESETLPGVDAGAENESAGESGPAPETQNGTTANVSNDTRGEPSDGGDSTPGFGATTALVAVGSLVALRRR